MAGTSLIEAYLAQLRSELPRRPDTADVIAEVEDHLHSIVEAHLSLGLSEEAAIGHALGVFGSADLVARAFAQQQGDATAMPTTFTTQSGAAAILGGIIVGVCLALGSVTTLDVGPNSAWFAPTALSGAVLVAMGLVGIDARHRALYGSLGRICRLLLPVGVVGLVASAVPLFAPGPGYVVSISAAMLGLVGVGVEVWRGGVLSRVAIALVAVGLAGSLPASLVVNPGAATWTAGNIVAMVLFILMGAGVASLGYGLWRERGDLDATTGGRPTASA